MPNEGNAYYLFSFDASDPTNTADFIKYQSYGDCTALGMMGTACMTGKTDSMMTGGTMMAYASGLTITEVTSVPVPAAVWLFGSSLIGFLGASRRKNSLPS